MRGNIASSKRDDPLAATMLEDPFDASLDFPPYPGLRPFASAEWPIFFGREAMTDEIIGLLTKKHLVVVHGDSGSGKSSIVRAGVLVQLQQGHAATDATWRTCALLPREDPLGNLARALAGLLADEPTPDQILDTRHILNRGRRAPETLSRLLRRGEADHICILVDQFEELFSFARRRGPEDARLFVDTMVGLHKNPPPGLYAILTMRSEFLGHCARYDGLAEAVNKTQYLLPRMERPALLRAICQPATLYQGEVSRGLAERLIADAGGAQDQLPLIQHGLMRLWRLKIGAPPGIAEAAAPYAYGELRESVGRCEIDEAPLSFRRDDGPFWHLGLENYRGIGGLATLLSDHADEVLRRAALDPERRKIVEHLFRALTDINAEGQAIRRPQTFTELVAVTGSDAPTLEAIIDHFRAEGISFLTPYGDAQIKPGTLIDISHEALIRCWKIIADDKDGWLQREFQDGLVWKSLRLQAQRGETLSAAATTSRDEWLKTLPSPVWTERYDGGWEDVQQLMVRSRLAREEEAQRQRDYVKAQEQIAEEQRQRAEVERQNAAHAEAGRRRARRLAEIAAAFAVIAVLIALVAAQAAGWFAQRNKYVAFFPGSVKGLQVGAPVDFRGVTIGQVTQIRVLFDPQQVSARIPVIFELDPTQIEVVGREPTVSSEEEAERQIKAGLRAQLQSQSVLTGELFVNLDFYPDAPVRLVGGDQPYPEVPTIPSGFEQLQQSAGDVAARLPELLDHLNGMIIKLDQSLEGTGDDFSKIVNDVAVITRRVSESTPELVVRAEKAADELERIAQTLDGILETNRDAIGSMIDEWTVTATAIRRLADQVHPPRVDDQPGTPAPR